MTRSTSLIALLAFGTALAAAGAAHAAGDAKKGAIIFRNQCAVCHSPVAGQNRVGPSLFGVVGRKAGTVPGFHYSAANKSSGIVWTEAELDKYLASPQKVVHGTTMPFAGIENPVPRANVVAYLATLK